MSRKAATSLLKTGPIGRSPRKRPGYPAGRRLRFSRSMKAAVSARLAEAGRLRSARRSPRASEIFSTRRDRPVTSATASCPKRCTIWSRAEGNRSRDRILRAHDCLDGCPSRELRPGKPRTLLRRHRTSSSLAPRCLLSSRAPRRAAAAPQRSNTTGQKVADVAPVPPMPQATPLRGRRLTAAVL